jgi:hypothetical protein
VIYVQRSYRKPILRRIEPEFRVDRARRAASRALASEPGREARRLVALALALVGNGKHLPPVEVQRELASAWQKALEIEQELETLGISFQNLVPSILERSVPFVPDNPGEE